MYLRRSILLLTVGVFTATAQTGEPATEHAESQSDAATDAEIEDKIRKRFAGSAISEDGFQVSVRGGVATLRGRTDVVQHKGTATRLARLAGAKSVDNRIEVTDRARSRASRSSRSQPRRVHVQRAQPGQHDGR